MNHSTKLKAVIGIQVLLVILTLLFLIGTQPSNGEFKDSYKTHVGIFLLIFGVLGLIGTFWKTKFGFMLSLTYQYFILFILAIGLFATLSDLRAMIILITTIFILIFSVISFNNKEIKIKYTIFSNAVTLNICSAITSLLFSMAFLLYLG